ncbi:oxygenase MpaB family protein [Streptomyces sp. NPDC004296]|uniref:oxygenase MpaB family protein n=1 Tax=Streptomyces sp. NPDC004296 TaxID=3364697 RepID=UPI003678728B
MRDVGRVWVLKGHHLPPDWASFCAYCDGVVAGRLELNDSVRDVLAELARPQKPPVWRFRQSSGGRSPRSPPTTPCWSTSVYCHRSSASGSG